MQNSFFSQIGRRLRPTSDPYELALARGREEMGIKNGILDGAFGIGSGGFWGADLEKGEIRFDMPDGIVVTAPMQVIGTLDTDAGTWLWGWNHPSVPEPLSKHAEAVRSFGLEHGVERLTTRIVEAEEKDAWDFTALALHLSGAQGAYRGPAGATLVMMTFDAVTARGPDGGVK